MDLIKYLRHRPHVLHSSDSLYFSRLHFGIQFFSSTHSQTQVDKVIQLYETMLTRHCTMIVGPTGGGKSVVINTLVKAQTTMGITTKCSTLNPKVCRHVKKKLFLKKVCYGERGIKGFNLVI
jgi:ribosome biogenesis GTPase A